MREGINTVQKEAEFPLDVRKVVGLETNAEKSHQTARHIHNIKITRKSFENVEKLKHLRMTVTNQNLIHEKITTDKIRVN
jgi:hypothetical protein